MYDNNGKLKKENFDACDSLVCALAYINTKKYGEMKPEIVDCDIEKVDSADSGSGTLIKYSMNVWDKKYQKQIFLDTQ